MTSSSPTLTLVHDSSNVAATAANDQAAAGVRDARSNTRFFVTCYVLLGLGIAIAMGVFGLVAYDHSASQTQATSSVSAQK
ncbi:MAG: hypothetical protein WCI29_04530 [Actinomycetes bacterium]